MTNQTLTPDQLRGDLLRKFRKGKGMDATQLATALNARFDIQINSNAITRIERGDGELRCGLADQCAAVLGLQLNAFSLVQLDVVPESLFPQSFKNKIGLATVKSLRKACDQLQLLFTDNTDD